MTTVEPIAFYWRPGCGFCMLLERALTSAEIPFEKYNIWDDADHAAFVRSVAGGNETVPTVRIGDRALVNPHITDVVEAMQSVAGPPAEG